MKISGAASVLLFLAGHATQVHSHGTEVRRCVTPEGNLRIFIEHWHGRFSQTITLSNAGTMTIRQDHLPGQPTTTINPTGVVVNTLPGNLPGCIGSDTLVSDCGGTYNDW
jgi:hypothetical protein